MESTTFMSMYFSSSVPSPTEITCDNDFNCFWTNCKKWVIVWYITAGCDFLCACWALIELIHVYASIYKIKSTTSQIFNNKTNNHNVDNADNYGSNYMLSFNNNHNNHTPISSKTKSIVPSSPSSASSNIQMFETRLSQKLFLIIIFFEALSRTYLFIDAPFSFKHCTMTKVDAPSLLYAIMGDIAPNLFCYAFSCLAFELSKIYFTLTKPREYEVQDRNKSIKWSLIFVITLVFAITVQTIIVDIYFIFYFNDKDKYKNIKYIYEGIDFYSYGIFCCVLGLYFIRFAFPIYAIYKQILTKLNYQKAKQHETVIESSISSDIHPKSVQNGNSSVGGAGIGGAGHRSLTHSSATTKKKKYHKRSKSRPKYSSIALQTDYAVNYFVASMKRTWIFSLYCGIAFFLRAVVILAFPDELESDSYVLGSYQFLFEIVPNVTMLYIYHYSTKNMNERYAINR